MTDYSIADRIAATWDRVRTRIAGAFHADTYELIRFDEVEDGRGGETVTEDVIEAGRCQLVQRPVQGREGLSGDILQSSYRLTAEMPEATLALPDDEIQINGRRYRIVSVQPVGEHGLFPAADLEQVT